MAKGRTRTTIDHDEIRRWVEEHGGWPAEVASTEREGAPGILRIDFPGYTGEGSLKEISWEEWLDKFDRASLAFIFQETTSGGERSNFNKLIGRETAALRAKGERTTGRSRRSASSARREAPRAAAARTAARKGKSKSGASRGSSSRARSGGSSRKGS